MLLLQGELATFQKLSAIQANCAIERTLDACMAKLTEQVAQERKLRVRPSRGVFRSRIPSWLHLPALGMIDCVGGDLYMSGTFRAPSICIWTMSVVEGVVHN